MAKIFCAIALAFVLAACSQPATPTKVVTSCDVKPTVDDKGKTIPGDWKLLTTDFITVIELYDGSRETIHREGNTIALDFIPPYAPLEAKIPIQHFQLLPGPEVVAVSHGVSDSSGLYSAQIYFWFWTCGGNVWIVTEVGPLVIPTPTSQHAGLWMTQFGRNL